MTTSLVVDRTSPLPLYHQLKTLLQAEINRKDLKPGDRLPSEHEIEVRFGVSRATIRQALNSLVQEGVVERIQGVGTFVAHPHIRHSSGLISFTEDMRGQGLTPSHEVLESLLKEAPDSIRERLDLGQNHSTWYLRRLHLADSVPVGIGETWIPLQHLGAVVDALAQGEVEIGSLYDFLESSQVGVKLDSGTETVTADLSDDALAELLRCESGSPLLRVERITYMADSRPIEVSRMAFVASRYEYRTEIFRKASS
jgi:GntR family transcriptional regulator